MKKGDVDKSLKEAGTILNKNSNALDIAIIVSGQALIKIAKDTAWTERFIDICS